MQGMELVGEKKQPDAEAAKEADGANKTNGLLEGKGGTYETYSRARRR
jgi:hypothetical protein